MAARARKGRFQCGAQAKDGRWSGGMTEAMRDALKWLSAHNGDGAFAGRGHTLIAAGEIAPFLRSTWNALLKSGHVEEYQGRKRIRLTELGRQAA